MIKILCYGDSNTWGCSPSDSTRFDENTRWPMVMSSNLGENYTIIEDGLNGRTVLNLSPVNFMANGIECISSVINNYIPFDIAVISLGLNDIFISEEATLSDISNGIETIINIIRNNHKTVGLRIPDIIIMSPPEFNRGIEGVQFFELQINKLDGLAEVYKQLAAKVDCYFFDASSFVKGSNLDGSHLEAESHILLGKKIAEFIVNIIK